MILATEGSRIRVLLDTVPLQDPTTLLDSEVRLNATSTVNVNSQRQFMGVDLNMARPEDLTVITPASKNIPVSNIDALLRYRPGVGVNYTRAQIQGLVTYYDGSHVMVIQNGNRAVFAQLAEPTPIAVGTWVSAYGYPRTHGYTPTVIDVRVYPREGDGAVSPKPLTATEALSGRYDALLVRMKGQLIDHSYSREEQLIALRDGDTSFVAQFPRDSKDWVSKLQDSSELELTGVLRVQGASIDSAAQSFFILLRTGHDVVVVQHPSWLSRSRLLFIALILGAVIVCILIWVSILRRQVFRQTRKLLDQRRREAQREKSHRVLVENASDLIFTLTLRGQFLSANPATATVTGWAIPELSTISFCDLLPADQQKTFDKWFEALVERSHGAGEFDIRTISGSIRTLDLSAHVSKSNPEQAQVEFVGRDITERKRIHSALDQARQAAESANAAKTRFLANMSHEIRTPLNAILGMADLLATTDLSAQQRTYVATFQNSGTNLLSLLNGILDLAKVESGQLELEFVPFPVEALVTDTISVMAGSAHNKRVGLVYEIDGGVPAQVIGDRNRLRQILVNLLGNAVKFTEKGEVGLKVTSSFGSAEYEKGKITLNFSVKDTGIGISPEKLDLIFERFTQADNSITRRFGGSGLGLSISRGLARAMGGAIEVHSTPGQGSEFILQVPVMSVPALSLELQSSSAKDSYMPDGIEILKWRRAAILVAEDNEANRMVIEAYLNGFPFVVDCAQNGRQAVEMEARRNYDLVLMDIEMPEMDGYEATRRICERRSLAGLPRIPIVALSAHAFDEDRGESEQAGCSEFLTKPIRRKVLLSSLARHLGRQAPDEVVIS
jgi:PAS domain S-box-containing protein